ncbi:acetate--CoA ligase family protein [Futiania mangrovi]|uniref:Acetate--CoA ligase family protein n=1 Tax=Futiania mangrovi TaxID=2959716 RepID=A0A9J6PLR5_9PROT|nr:acetate--CoA ligase family protein [Futiania mangrovii]MCP1336986.1 acetate--CoA ligase family protein [Futiania mangrovii]
MTVPARGAEALTRMFQPRSVAIVGASDDPARISGRALRFLREAGFAGGLYPVNPRRETVQGLRAYPSVADIPEVPDVGLIAVPAAMALDAVRDCAAKGMAGVYVFSSGFSEAGVEGAKAQAEILRVAREAGMRVLGPNCLGAFNSEIGFFGMFATSLDRGLPSPGPVAVVSQSGAHGQHIAYMARQRGLGVTYCITTGNEMDVDAAEVLDWVVRQPDVKVVMVYAEGVRDGARLVSALKTARALKKPVVFMKVGSSAAGARAVSSHTSALAGADAIHDAVLRQYGAWRAVSTQDQVDIAYACAWGIYPASGRVGLVSVSGGGGVQMADFAERFGLDAAPMPEGARAKLREIMPHAAPENPFDVTGQIVNDASLMERALRVLCTDTDYDVLAGYFTTVALDRGATGRLRDAILKGTEGHDRLIVLCMLADPETVRAYEEAGFLVYEDPYRAMAAVAALRFFAESFARAEEAAAPLPPACARPGGPLDEVAARRLLAEAGLPVLPETLAASADEAAAAADAMGYPVAMKIVSPDIAHKTEIGGVLLNVADRAAVRAGFDTLTSRARDAAPGARLSGILVTPMARKGVETIVGVTVDPTFGPVVMFGLGGVFVEVFRDVCFRAAPFGVEEARAMIPETKAASLLAGARGAPAADVEALAHALAAVSRFAAANAHWLDSIDINPFLVLPAGEGALALDAVIVPSPDAPGDAADEERKAS